MGEDMNQGRCLEVVNEDGSSILDYPRNPLAKKWAELYPPTPKPEYSQICDGYSCMWCSRCPNGNYWRVPEEDEEVWETYLQEIHEYNLNHGNIIDNIRQRMTF